MPLDQLDRELKRLPKGARRQAERIITLFGSMLAEVPEQFEEMSKQLSDLQARFSGHLSTLAHSEGLLTLQNELRRAEFWRELDAQTLGRPELPNISRQALAQRRDDGKMVAIKPPNKTAFRYPAWQFDSEFRVRSEVPDLLREATGAGLSPLELHLLMLSEGAGGGITPFELLRRGQLEQVRRIIRAQGDQAA